MKTIDRHAARAVVLVGASSWAVVLAFALGGLPGCVAGRPQAPAPVVPDDIDESTPALLLKFHNAERAKVGLQPLRPNAKLQRAAEYHADFMAKVGRLGHFGIGDGDPWSRIKAAGYDGDGSENIGWNMDTEAEAVRAWMQSHGHRANVLDRKWVDFGGAVAQGRSGPYWAAVFGAGDH